MTGNQTAITKLFGIEYPIIQAGMLWCSGWRLASAASNAGALGLIGAGSMYPEVLRDHIKKCRQATDKPFGVNIPLLYPDIEQHMQSVVELGVKIVFTSAGSPKKWTPFLKDHGITVVHVVAGTRFAEKCQTAGVDAVVAEGFEAGGHNGREETTTMCLIPRVRDKIALPLIAAGGISDGRAILAAMALGADGVQIGSRFVASEESSAHVGFKQKVIEASEGDTMLTLKQLTPVRLIKNNFFEQVAQLEKKGGTPEQFKELLGRGRAKLGMFEGNLDQGELEIGQVSAMIDQIKPAKEIIEQLWREFEEARKKLCHTG